MEKSPSIPLDFSPQNAAEYKVARDNFPWWAARFTMIADKDASEPHPLFLNKPQEILLDFVENERNDMGGGQYLVLKARQEGVSTFIEEYFSWFMTKGAAFYAMIIAHETKASQNMLSMVKRSYDSMEESWLLPSGERVPVKPTQKASSADRLHVIFDKKGVYDSQIIIDTASKPGKEDDAGRSFALNALHFSEVGKRAFDDGRVIGGAMNTLSRAAIVFAEGTAQGAFGWFYEEWIKARRDYAKYLANKKLNPNLKYNGWVPIFLPWFIMPSYSIALQPGEVIEAENEFEKKLMNGENTYESYQVTPEQIKWHRWILATKCPSGGALTPLEWWMQEYPSNDIECFLQSGGNYFPVEAIQEGLRWSREYIHNNPPQYYNIIDGKLAPSEYGKWEFLAEPDPEEYNYVLGGDVAEGLERGDYDVSTIIEIRPTKPNRVIAMWRDKEPLKARHAYENAIVGKLCGNAMIGIENNLHGISVNQHLWEDSYPNMYISSPEDEGDFKTGTKTRYGFSTTSKTRGLMLGFLQNSIYKWYMNKFDPDGLEIGFPIIWDEMNSFIKVRGKVEAAPGTHDDCVFAIGITNHLALQQLPKFKVSKDIVYDSSVLNVSDYFKRQGKIVGQAGVNAKTRKRHKRRGLDRRGRKVYRPISISV